MLYSVGAVVLVVARVILIYLLTAERSYIHTRKHEVGKKVIVAEARDSLCDAEKCIGIFSLGEDGLRG